jgi:hypothetical protein
MGQTPTSAVADDGSKQSLALAGTDVLALAGFGGTSPLTDNMSFLIDFTGYYGLTEPFQGGRHQGVNVGLGISYEL